MYKRQTLLFLLVASCAFAQKTERDYLRSGNTVSYTHLDVYKRQGLMNELTKIKNVMKKVVADAPHEVLLVLDGSTGQNAFEQAKQFTLATEVTACLLYTSRCV